MNSTPPKIKYTDAKQTGDKKKYIQKDGSPFRDRDATVLLSASTASTVGPSSGPISLP